MITRSEIASKYIRENFVAEDRIAVVLLNKRTGRAVQRIAAAEKIASPEFQAWLRHMNAAQKHEVYISMNTLKEGTRGRTRDDVDRVKHIYLDFDENGTAAVEGLLKREDLPDLNYLVNTSLDRWQVIWKVTGFEKDQAEELERGLVRETGADPAVIDVARVLRLPGFYSHKHGRPHFVTVEARSDQISGPEHFPRFTSDDRLGTARARTSKAPSGARITQSERDWAYVRSALASGAAPAMLIEELKARRPDKWHPEDYAKRTVQKAVESFRQPESAGPER